MSRERHEALRRLFDEALELSDDQWPAFCVKRCGDDTRLRRELEDLLAHCPRSTIGPTSFDAIGPYRVERALAVGGMSRVFVATEPLPLARRVAIKVLRTDLGSQAAIDRFHVECQLLARLTHPGIARVYNAGTLETGRPWFAMEFVEGARIHDFVRDEGLDSGSRLDLVQQVGEALDYAHQRGVLHLDVKPANVLVTRGLAGRPYTKLIDFGIGRDVAGAQPTPAKSIGSPDYMSPEQLDPKRSAEVDARSDVFSMGALLFEVLAERKLFESGVDRVDDGSRPRIEIGTVVSDLRSASALDTVVATATHPDPTQRYRSIGALVDAISGVRLRRSARGRILRVVAVSTCVVVGFAVGFAVTQAMRDSADAAVSGEAVLAHLLEWTASPTGVADPRALDRVDGLIDTVDFELPVDEAMARYAVGALRDDIGDFRPAAEQLLAAKCGLIRADRADFDPMVDVVARLGRLRHYTDDLLGDPLEVAGVLVERIEDADERLGELLAAFVNQVDHDDAAAVFGDLESALSRRTPTPVVRSQVAEALSCAARHHASVGAHPVAPVLSLALAQRGVSGALRDESCAEHRVRFAGALLDAELESVAAGEGASPEGLSDAGRVLSSLESTSRLPEHQQVIANSLRECWRVVAGEVREPAAVEDAYRRVATVFEVTTCGPCRGAARRWLLASLACGVDAERARDEFLRIDGVAMVQPASWSWREPAFRADGVTRLRRALRDFDGLRERRVERWSSEEVETRVRGVLEACRTTALAPAEAVLCAQQMIATCRHDRGALTEAQRTRVARRCLELATGLPLVQSRSLRRLAMLELARSALYSGRFEDAVARARDAMELTGSRSTFDALYPRSILVEAYAAFDSARAKREVRALHREMREHLPPQHSFAAYVAALHARVVGTAPPR